VFPLGMYAAMSFAVGELAGLAWMRAFARDWTWLAVAAWALVLLDAVRPVSEVRRTPSAAGQALSTSGRRRGDGKTRRAT
jgi:tellurite resistance protein TehA-like permease